RKTQTDCHGSFTIGEHLSGIFRVPGIQLPTTVTEDRFQKESRSCDSGIEEESVPSPCGYCTNNNNINNKRNAFKK
ncbi:hypothetical protein AVEN_38636-2-1, partial [Araneus ventricosus]